MDIPIIYEDEVMLVIDKPAGMIVNRAETTAGAETVQDWAERRLGIKKELKVVGNGAKDMKRKRGDWDTKKEFEERTGIVHRLDKDTSGLLVIAKTTEGFAGLKAQFKERAAVKKYLALVHGKVEPAEGEIKAPIERNPFNRMHFGVFPGGREAVTGYHEIANYRNANCQLSLLEVQPHTGRTHQIRVHLKYINHPVVSDPIYGGRKNLQEDRKFCPRLFLHAAFLRIKNPGSGEMQEFQSELPFELADALGKLQKI